MDELKRAAFIAPLIEVGIPPHMADLMYEHHCGGYPDVIVDKEVSEKGFNPSQPRVPAGGPGGGRWAGGAFSFGGAPGKIKAALQKFGQDHPKLAAKFQAEKPFVTDGKPLSKLERFAITQGVKHIVGSFNIQSPKIRLAMVIGLNILMPRLIRNLSPVYRKYVMRAFAGMMVKSGIESLGRLLEVAHMGRTLSSEELMKTVKDLRDNQPAMTRTELEELVRNYGTKEKKSGMADEELYSKAADLITKWSKECAVEDGVKELREKGYNPGQARVPAGGPGGGRWAGGAVGGAIRQGLAKVRGSKTETVKPVSDATKAELAPKVEEVKADIKKRDWAKSAKKAVSIAMVLYIGGHLAAAIVPEIVGGIMTHPLVNANFRPHDTPPNPREFTRHDMRYYRTLDGNEITLGPVHYSG